MSRKNQDQSYQESRFPQGTTVAAVLLTVLVAGLFLIIRGLV